jgi:hypothetical protein
MANTKHATGAPGNGQPADPEAAAQAITEGVPADFDHVEFSGETFELAAKVGYMPLLKFAHYAARGGNTAEMGAMAAMYEMLRGCFLRSAPCGTCEVCTGNEAFGVDPDPAECASRETDEWRRFEQHAIDVSADDQDLFEVVQQVIVTVTSRPTQR